MTKTALITGAAGGIGRSLCEEFSREGYRVIATDVKSCDVGDVFVPVDLIQFCADSDYRRDIVTKLSEAIPATGLDVLVNNAALQRLGSAEELTYDDWQETFQVNVFAPFLLTQQLLSLLTIQQGSVINISSIHEQLTKARFTAYAASKAALGGMTRALAVDLGNKIRINTICPAATATEMLKAGFEDDPEGLALLKKMHPLQRIAEPKEIARVALFLASEDSGFISGSSLSVNGGIGGRLHDPG